MGNLCQSQERLGLPIDGVDVTRVLGKGRDSVCMPLGEEKVVVVRGGFENVGEALELATRQNRAEQVIGPGLQGCSVGAQYFLADVNDGGGHSIGIVRVKPRVRGIEARAIPLVEILSDPNYAASMAQLMRASLETLITTGYLPNLVGYSSQQSFGQFIRERLPYRSGNLMLDELTGKSALIDCEVDPREWCWGETSSITQKARMVISGAALAVSMGIYGTAEGMHRLVGHGKEPMPVQKSREQKEKGVFADKFRSLIQGLEGQEVNYRVLGSVALASVTGQSLSPRRVDGSWRDIDILVLDSLDEKPGQKAQQVIESLDSEGPKISLTFVQPSYGYQPRSVGRGIASYLSEVAKEADGSFSLRYGEQIVPLGNSLAVERAKFEQMEFNTLGLAAQVGMYLTREGSLRLEDRAKIRKAIAARKVVVPECFWNFAERIKREYPREYRNAIVRQALNLWTRNLFSRAADSISTRYPLDGRGQRSIIASHMKT